MVVAQVSKDNRLLVNSVTLNIQDHTSTRVHIYCVSERLIVHDLSN